MKNKDFWNFVMTVIKCFVILMVVGLLLPKAVDFLLQNLISNTKIYQNSTVVYNLVDKNYKLIYNYILTFYLFFRF